MAVHDVDVDQIGAAALGGGDLRRRAPRNPPPGSTAQSAADASPADLERDRLARRDLEPGLRALAQDDAGGHARIGMIADDGDAEAARRAAGPRRGRR